MTLSVFISHYVQIKLKSMRCRKIGTELFISHYVQIKRGKIGDSLVFMGVYIPLRSDKTIPLRAMLPFFVTVYIPLRSDKTRNRYFVYTNQRLFISHYVQIKLSE